MTQESHKAPTLRAAAVSYWCKGARCALIIRAIHYLLVRSYRTSKMK